MDEIRLTGEDWEQINQDCGFDVADIIINLDNRYSSSQQMEMIVERCDKVNLASIKKVVELLKKEGRESLDYYSPDKAVKEWCIPDELWQEILKLAGVKNGKPE